MTVLDTPTVTVPVRHRTRGYYTDPQTGEQLRSVTTILSQGVPKEALVHWAGNLTAETAMANIPMLVRASKGTEADRTEAYNWLRKAPTRKKDDRADIGSAVHRLIEARILGEPIAQDLLDDPEMVPFIARFEEFCDAWRVEFQASEMVVANYTHSYAGTLDFLFHSPFLDDNTLNMGDTKTGGTLDVKGVYAEAGLQSSAYRHAEFGWLRDGSKVEMPETAGGYVLHLRPEGFRLLPVRCDGAVFDRFLLAKQMATYSSVESKSIVGTPLHPGEGHDLGPDGACRHCPYPVLPAARKRRA